MKQVKVKHLLKMLASIDGEKNVFIDIGFKEKKSLRALQDWTDKVILVSDQPSNEQMAKEFSKVTKENGFLIWEERRNFHGTTKDNS